MNQSVGTTYWITGLSGAGKSTLGGLLYSLYKKSIHNIVILDGDELRAVIKNTDYSSEGRKSVAFQYARLCRLLTEQGIHVIICTISMYEDVRKWNRKNLRKYCEIYIKVPIKELIFRDQKGLYSRAMRKEISNVMGVDVPFEEPQNPDIVIENDGKKKVEYVFSELVEKLESWQRGEEP